MHKTNTDDKLLILPYTLKNAAFVEWRGHHASRIVYNPDYEYYGNDVPTALPNRHDTFIYLDETQAFTHYI